MNLQTRRQYQEVAQRTRSISARAEALACGFESQDGHSCGDHREAFRRLREDVAALATFIEEVPHG